MTARRSSASSVRNMPILIIFSVVLAMTGIALTNRMAILAPLTQSIGHQSPYAVSAHLEDQHEFDPVVNSMPEIAWLMTYPNSGTTYTLKLIQQYTNTTTATNYGNEQNIRNDSIPVHPAMKNGPFPRFLEWQLPPRYILTKTHCGGTSLSPDPLEYVETVRSFEIACRSGSRIENNGELKVTYSMDIPKRAVHLIRSPFDVSL
jgi:hypothetical protein